MVRPGKNRSDMEHRPSGLASTPALCDQGKHECVGKQPSQFRIIIETHLALDSLDRIILHNSRLSK